MLVRFNPVVRSIRIGFARRIRRTAGGEMLYAEGVLAGVLQAQRAVGVAAVIGAAGWVLLR